jgi:hypothetical protein
MKTLTMSDAQKRLPSVLKQVKQGKDIGIIAGDQIIQLKPVQIVAPPEWERFKRRMKTRRAKEHDAEFTGAFDPGTFA